MGLLAHHIGIEILGQEYSPQTPAEHVMWLAVTLVLLALMGYGTWSLVRDFRHWRRRANDLNRP